MLPKPIGPVLADAHAQGLYDASGMTVWAYTRRPYVWLGWNISVAAMLCAAFSAGYDKGRNTFGWYPGCHRKWVSV